MTASSLASLVEPAYCSVPPYAATLGPEVAELCRSAGFAPDPEQELALDALFAVGGDCKCAAFEFCIICARQNLKTALLKMAVIGWLFVTEEELIVWSAHEMTTTREAFRDLENLIKGYRPFRSRLADTRTEGIYHSNAELLIELKSGQRVKFKARTAGGGRGLTGDKVVLDEAMFLEPSHMDSLMPTLSAVPNPQLCYAGSAGLLKSAVLRGVRDRGRKGTDPELAYLEWCAPGSWARPPCKFGVECAHLVGIEGCALDNREFWPFANPAVRHGRITFRTIAAERRALTPLGFGRERFGWWDDPPPEDDADDLARAKSRWPGLADEGAPAPTGRVALAVDVSKDRSATSIAAAWRLDDRVMVMVTHLPGTSKAVAVLKGLVAVRKPVDLALHAGGPAGSLVKDLEAEDVDVRSVSTSELARDTGTFIDRVTNAGIGHLNQPELNTALAEAGLRKIGDAMVWNIDVLTNMAPLRAATLAVGGFVRFGGDVPPPPPRVAREPALSETSDLSRAGF